MGYLIKSLGTQTMKERHGMFSNLVLKGKLREAVRFVCDKEKGGVLKPDELDEDCTARSTRPPHRFWRGNILAKQFPLVPR